MNSQPNLRRGLPRVSGGQPWPPQDQNNEQQLSSTRLRQGLPRTPGGSPWPPVNYAAAAAPTSPSQPGKEPEPSAQHAAPPNDNKLTPTTGVTAAQRFQQRRKNNKQQTAAQNQKSPQTNAGQATNVQSQPSPQQPQEQHPSTPAATPVRQNSQKESVFARQYGAFSLRQWLGGGLVGLGSIFLVAALVVMGTRWFLNTETGADFIATYDGHPELPESSPEGIPTWLAWQHFLNFFFMALIVKTGFAIRYERKAPAYWAPKKNPGQKISLTIWTHLILDLLWVINGGIFFILLFATGQWVRIVPTSLDIFPHAVSAGLQYASLDWPTENGWVHYNGLQLLMYFFTVFIVAPAAIATGLRMSHLWPGNPVLAKIYPVSIARKMHISIALYFLVFTVIHVLMVFATGALRNLNHMWAAQGDPDPTAYAGNWTGFIFFVIGLVVTAATVVFARPMVLAPFARLFGKVTAR